MCSIISCGNVESPIRTLFNVRMILTASSFTDLGIRMYLATSFQVLYVISSVLLQGGSGIINQVDLVDDMLIRISPVHPKNAEFAIHLTDLGTWTDVSRVHPLNVLSPMLVTESGILISRSPLHPLNASSPI